MGTVLSLCSMNAVTRLRKHPDAFRRMTGITPEKFDEILRQLKPIYEEWNTKRLTRPKRRRKIGGGRPFDLVLEDRLLMLFIYHRTYAAYVFLGFLFHIDDSNVGRNINPLQPLLQKIFRIPERKAEPQKKPKGGELTERQKLSNRRFSSERVVVEHGIGKMKIWRMAAERFRNKPRTHTVMLKNVAGLHNLMFA